MGQDTDRFCEVLVSRFLKIDDYRQIVVGTKALSESIQDTFLLRGEATKDEDDFLSNGGNDFPNS